MKIYNMLFILVPDPNSWRNRFFSKNPVSEIPKNFCPGTFVLFRVFRGNKTASFRGKWENR